MVEFSKINGLAAPTAADPSVNTTTNINVAQTISGTPGTTWTSVYSHTVSGYSYGMLYFLKNDWTGTASTIYDWYVQILVDGSVVYSSYTYESATKPVKHETGGVDYICIGTDEWVFSTHNMVPFKTSLEIKVSPWWTFGTRYCYLDGWYFRFN
jgi:hypothetical protein